MITRNNLNRNEVVFIDIRAAATELTSLLTMSQVVYEIKCPVGGCELLNPSYIGQTRNIRTSLNHINRIDESNTYFTQ